MGGVGCVGGAGPRPRQCPKSSRAWGPHLRPFHVHHCSVAEQGNEREVSRKHKAGLGGEICGAAVPGLLGGGLLPSWGQGSGAPRPCTQEPLAGGVCRTLVALLLGRDILGLQVATAASVRRTGRRSNSLVPRTPHGARGPAGPSTGSPPAPVHLSPPTSGGRGANGPGGSPSPQKQPARGVPVSTTVVQDGVKWLNLVRFANFARLLQPIIRPRGRRRPRLPPSARKPMLPQGPAGADKPRVTMNATAPGVNGSPAQAGKIRPIYIQVRHGRQLVWPSFEGVEHSCFCLLLVGDQPRGTTQAVPVASNSSANCVTWNEIFSFPRSILEGSAGGRVTLQVWSSETFGDDILVGQADLALGGLMEAEQPHPITALLELQAIDEDTGEVEPGSCGELLVAAWAEPDSGDDKLKAAARKAAASSLPDLHEAGVITSNMSAPCGSKSIPQVVHSPLGTLYEEPCVVVLKMAITGLVDLNYELLASSARETIITKKRVRLEAAARERSNAARSSKGGAGAVGGESSNGRRDTAGGAGSGGAHSGGGAAVGGAAARGVARGGGDGGGADGGRGGPEGDTAPSASIGLPSMKTLANSSRQNVPYASTSLSRGLGAYVERMHRTPQQGSLMRRLQSAQMVTRERSFSSKIKGAWDATVAATTAAAAMRRRLPRAGRRGGATAAAGGGGGGGHAAAAAGGGAASGDELMDEDDTLSGAGTGGVMTEDGQAATYALDDPDDASSLAINPTAPLSGMAAEEPAAGAGQGQGLFCYFKVSVDKQSAKSRLRWLAAPPSPSSPSDPVNASLQPSTFVFVLPRPLANAPVGLNMYATTSARRRGRVVGRVVVPLYDILDDVLGSTVIGAGGMGRKDMGVSGKPIEVMLPFEDEELGAVRVIVQLADVDERAQLFRVPLVSDPQQLVADSHLQGAYGGGSHLLGPGAEGYPSPSCSGAVPAGAGGAAGGPRVAMGPVLGDTALLRNVLARSEVEADVEQWFARSYARVGSLKAAGMMPAKQRETLLARLLKVFLSGRLPHGGGGAWDAGLGPPGGPPTAIPTGLPDPSASCVVRDLAALFDEQARSITAGASPVSLRGQSGAPSGGALLDGVLKSFLGAGAAGLAGAAGEAAGGPSVPGAGPAATAPAPSGPPALGSLVLRFSSINSNGALPGASCCCIVKCGPHWLRTVDQVAGDGSLPHWQVVIPVYSPATILTVGIFSNSIKSVMGLTFSDNLVLVSRVRLKLNRVRPFRPSWHVIAMYLTGANSGSGGGPPTQVGLLGIKMQYPSKTTLAASYLAASAPESLYELDLDSEATLKMDNDVRKVAENWLASVQPPIPPEVARLLLDDGRSTFKFPRIKTNWRRVKSGMQLLFSLYYWFLHIRSWKRPRDSWEVVGCIALLCYMPSTAFKLFFFMIALRGIKAFTRFKDRVHALAASGADAAAALVMSPAAASTAASAALNLAMASAAATMGTGAGGAGTAGAAGGGGAVAGGAGGGGGAGAGVGVLGREPMGTVGDMTFGGGVVDVGSDDEVGEDSKVPVGTVAEFKRKFAELIELGLLLQNLFDDVASILERMQNVLSFQDVSASLLFIVSCTALVGVVALLGFPTTFFLVLLWQVRPPSLQDPLPPPPFSYFMKLPCKSAAEFG